MVASRERSSGERSAVLPHPGLRLPGGADSKGYRSFVGRCTRGCRMNSTDRDRWLRPSAATPVDDDAHPDPDAKDSIPATDALSDLLRAMRDAVDERRERLPEATHKESNGPTTD